MGKRLTLTDEVKWTDTLEEAFMTLKLTLQTTPMLELLDPTRPFTLIVDDKNGCMTSGFFLQDLGRRLRPVAYFSARLDPVVAGMPQHALMQ